MAHWLISSGVKQCSTPGKAERVLHEGVEAHLQLRQCQIKMGQVLKGVTIFPVVAEISPVFFPENRIHSFALDHETWGQGRGF